ncbi:hypothetical protein Tco_0836780 [Tanacetum coccineum]
MCVISHSANQGGGSKLEVLLLGIWCAVISHQEARSSKKIEDDEFIRQDIRRLFYGRFSFYDPNVDKIKEVKQETDIKEKEQKESQKQANQSTEWKGQSQRKQGLGTDNQEKDEKQSQNDKQTRNGKRL